MKADEHQRTTAKINNEQNLVDDVMILDVNDVICKMTEGLQ
jgi:hypothetical protein